MESLDVGQRWLYRHEGPRPGSVEPNAIDGERIVWVLARVDGQGGELRIVEERFSRDEQTIARLLVRADGLLEAIEVATDKGQTARLRYDPPIPYRPPTMAVGETQAISTSLRMQRTSPCPARSSPSGWRTRPWRRPPASLPTAGIIGS